MDVKARGLPLQGTIRPSVPWCFPVQEAGQQQHQQQPKPAHQKQLVLSCPGGAFFKAIC